MKNNLESFNKKIKLRGFFHNKKVQKQATEIANKEPNIKCKTNWEPKKNHHTVETFIEAVNKDIVESNCYSRCKELYCKG